MKGRSVLSNLLAVGSAEGVARLAQLVTIAVVARYLGPVAFGIVGTAWAIYSMALQIVQGSPELIGIRRLAQNRQSLSIVAETNGLKFVLALGAVLSLSAFGLISYGTRSPLFPQIMVQSFVLIAVALETSWTFRSYQRFELSGSIRVFQTVATALLLVLVLPLFNTPLAVPTVEFITFLAAACLGYVLLQRILRKEAQQHTVRILPRSSGDYFNTIQRHGLSVISLGISGFATTMTWTVSIPIAQALLDADDVGLLTAAIRLIFIVITLFQVILHVFYPMLARCYHQNPKQAEYINSGLLQYLTIMSVLAVATLLVFAEPLLTLIFGAAFVGAVPTVQILSLSIVPVTISSICGYTLVAVGHLRAFRLFACCGTAGVVIVIVTSMALSSHITAVGGLVPVMIIQAIAMWVYCKRHGLLSGATFQPRRLTFSELWRFLGMR